MRGLAEGPLAPVDERCAHTVGLGANTIEGVVGDEQDVGLVLAEDFLGFGVGFPMRLKITGLLHRYHMIKREADMRLRCFEHVAIAV